MAVAVVAAARWDVVGVAMEGPWRLSLAVPVVVTAPMVPSTAATTVVVVTGREARAMATGTVAVAAAAVAALTPTGATTVDVGSAVSAPRWHLLWRALSPRQPTPP